MDPGTRFNLEQFERHVGDVFRLYPGEGEPLEVVMVRARRLHRDSLQDIFSIGFRGPENPALPQATYAFDHPRMGPFQIFLVPDRKEPGATLYEATFNLLLRPLRLD